MSWKDLAGLPQIPEIRSSMTRDEIDEMWYNAEHSYPKITIKPFTGKNEAPLRPMQRQHLPLGHPDRIPYEERMYMFFRDYRIDVERGRIACSDDEYRNALAHEDYYDSLYRKETKLFWRAHTVRIDISSPESRRAFFTYHWSKDPEAQESAYRTLLRYTKLGPFDCVLAGAMEAAGVFD